MNSVLAVEVLSGHRDLILKDIMRLYRAGRLDEAVTWNPSLKNETDYLAKMGHMTRGNDGHLTPGNPHAAWNVTERDWTPPPGVVLDNVMALYERGQLDAAVARNPDLRRITDALEASGSMQRTNGRLVPKPGANSRDATGKPA